VSNKEYFDYLTQRSSFGKVYRKYLLYPKLNKFLFGETLDVGCGIGDFLRFRSHTSGVDINPHLVKHCTDNALNVKQMDKDKLPHHSKSFDSAIMDNVLEHIVNPNPLLFEVHRILKDGGRLVVGVPGSLGYKSDEDHKIFYSKKLLIDTLEKNNFALHKIFGMPLNLNWLSDRIRQYCIYGIFNKISHE
tara:strand:- start:15 stop:584 length:570 start_codon:yes stop_codon:yes gene_type:complete